MLPDYSRQFSELAARKLSAEDLRIKGKIHRCETVSGSGRDRVTRYRSDIQCGAGNIEAPVWYRLVKDLATRLGEEQLLSSLMEYNEENHAFLHTKKEREEYTLELYSNRIFEMKEWVGYLGFWQKVCPEFLTGVSVAEIETDCCKKSGLTTKARIDHDWKVSKDTTCCPICGRWTPYQILREYVI